ncbi:MAG: PqiC family protein [Chromatiaceae bacterium]|nr:PqiC family protein [Chromatiaceae bacterium]
MHCQTALVLPALVLILAAGCASPPSRFYTLSTTDAAASPVSALSLSVGPVSVPAAVDRPQIVVSTGANQVHLDELNRWASPLKDEISRVVAENLVVMLGTAKVTQFPQTSSGEAAYRVAIEVQRFDSVPGSHARLDAVWTLRRVKDDKSRTGRTSVQEPVSATGFDGLAAAHSRAVARLSRDIADAVRVFEGVLR